MNAVDIEFGPASALMNPFFEKCDFVSGHGVALGRHFVVGVFGGDTVNESRVLQGARGDGWPLEFAAFEGVAGS